MACLEQIFKILKYDFANTLSQLLCIVLLKYELVKISIHYLNPLDPSKGCFYLCVLLE